MSRKTTQGSTVLLKLSCSPPFRCVHSRDTNPGQPSFNGIFGCPRRVPEHPSDVPKDLNLDAGWVGAQQMPAGLAANGVIHWGQEMPYGSVPILRANFPMGRTQ